MLKRAKKILMIAPFETSAEVLPERKEVGNAAV